MRTVAVAFLLLSIPLLGADTVDAYIQSELEIQKIPGLSLAIIRAGSVVKSKGYGLANVEHKVAASEDTVYLLASITKQFTSTAIMMLVREGKMKLDDTVDHYLDNTPAAWKGMTIRHILTDTSGLSRVIPYEHERGWLIGQHTLGEVLKASSAEPLLFPPGERFSYSNTGYCLLGYVIEKASGKSYWSFLQERIFQPLGMTATRSSDPTEIIPNRAGAYSLRGNRWINQLQPHPSTGFAAGCLLSSVKDLQKWDAALWTDKLLPQPMLKEMWTPARVTKGQTTYGFGWNIRDIDGRKFVGHNGEFAGTSTQIMRFLDDKLTIVLLVNRDQVNTLPIALRIYSLIRQAEATLL